MQHLRSIRGALLVLIFLAIEFQNPREKHKY
jgi:hypothetical protein